MKKIVGLLCTAVLSTAVFGQVLDSSGIMNSLSTGFGRGFENVNADHEVKFNGFTEKFQVRFDVGNFTVESMLAWDLFKPGINNNLIFEKNDLYVNFLLHPVKGLDIGAGTRLNWKVGKAPSSGESWMPTRHIVQGGLMNGDPGVVGVAGYAPYANKYSTSYSSGSDAALGVRFRYNDLFEAGITLPDALNTEAFYVNAGFQINPLDFLSASIAYDGIGRSNSNLFIGSSLYFNNISVDLYIAGNFRNKAYNASTLKYDVNNDRVGFGASVTVSIPSIGMTLKPEFGFTDYMHPDYTFAWYIGNRADITIADAFNIGLWISYANGAEKKSWADSQFYQSWNGGQIFNISPDVTWSINKRHSLMVSYDYLNRKHYNSYNDDKWNLGIAWIYKY